VEEFGHEGTELPAMTRAPLAEHGGKRTHNFAEREPITLVPTVGRDLGKRRFAQRFLVVPW
jgi:hypothetical protein